MKKIILCGHGTYAEGLRSALELLLGRHEDLLCINFLVDYSPEDLLEKMKEAIQQSGDAEILFVCDILGGTPYKNAAILAAENEHIEVVTGCNIGAILEALLQKETMSLQALAEQIVSSSIKFTTAFQKNWKNDLIVTETSSNEGI